MCKMIISDFNGTVPDTVEDLTKLQGVGRKTANLIVGDIYKKPAVVVDTHCMRVSARLGLSFGKDPLTIEKELMKILPKEEWAPFGHLMVDHGRAVCNARSPKCRDCALLDLCPTGKKKVKNG